jgi:hypothetical protein
MHFGTERPEQLRRAEWVVCLGAMLAAIGLHVVYLTHAGGLWRDETNSIHIATSATVGELWRLQAYSSFPALFDVLVRCWWTVGLGGSDLGFRWLGFLIGLALLGAVWLNARVLRASLPLFSLGLLATNLTLVRWGDSLRAYGLGALLTLLTLALVWSLIRAPSVWRFMAATLAAVFSVQCLYQNAFLLSAICLAGCFVCFRRRQDRTGLIVVAVGVMPALSLLPYLGPAQISRRWWVVEQTGFNAGVVWSSFSDALGSPMAWTIPVWIGLGVAAACRGGLHLLAGRRWRRQPGEEVRLFAAITLALSAFLFLTFVAISRLPTQPWYWLPLMVPAAVCIDTVLGDWLERYRGWRVGFVALITFVPLLTGVSLARYRQTNLDLIAARLRDQAKPNDLILVYPWFYGLTFNRYYAGAAPWTTLPALADLRVHRYDLLKKRMAATNPIQPVLDRIAQTLTTGNRLWVVGELPAPETRQAAPLDLPPAPDSQYGWADMPYTFVWGRQTERFITEHGGHIEAVPLDSTDPVSAYEKCSLAVVKGWASISDPAR